MNGNNEIYFGSFEVEHIPKFKVCLIKSLLDYTNLFPPNDYEKNDKIIPKHFQQIKR